MNHPVPRLDAASENPALRNRQPTQDFKRLRTPHSHAIDGARSYSSPGEMAKPAGATALAAAARPAAPLDMEILDWDVLFGAIQTKLMLTVDGLIKTKPECPASEATTRLRVTVLECVAAMDLLHSALSQERGLNCQPKDQEALFYTQWLRGGSTLRFHQ